MAGPLQNMLYRRPVRNAIRALLGMQPRYGYGNMGQPRGRMRGTPAETGQTASQTAAAGVGPLPPFPPLSDVVVPTSSPVAAATDPVKTAAALAAPAPDAMAQVVGFTRPDEEEAPSPSDAPVFKTPALDRYLNVAAEASQRNSATGAVSPAERARGGLFANLPATTPTPATTAMSIATDPRAETIRQEREQTLARATAKRKAAEGLQAAPAVQAVSQPAAQASPEPPLATAPADPFAAQRALAQQHRQRAAMLDANLQKMMQQMGRETDVNKRAYQNLEYQAEHQRRAQEIADAVRIENQIDASMREERIGARAERLEQMKNPQDTLQRDMEELIKAVRSGGVEAAALGYGQRAQAAVKGTLGDAAVQSAENFARTVGYGVQLGDYVTAGGKLSQLTSDSPLISGIASLPEAADDKSRRQLIAKIVGNTQNIVRSNGGDGGMSNPQGADRLIKALDAMVKQAVDANKPKGIFW